MNLSADDSPLDVETRHYALEQVERYASAQGLRPSWEGPGNGGYLLRAEVDLTGDGKPELLLTSTLELLNQVTSWRVFENTRDGSLWQYPEAYVGSANVYRPARDAAGDMVVLRYDRNRRHLDVMTFKGGRQEHKFIPDNAPEWDNESYVFQNYETKWPEIRFPVNGIKLCDYAAGSQEWEPIDFEKPAPGGDGYFIVATDAEVMRGNKSFTPDVALLQLRSLPPLSAAPSITGGNGNRLATSEANRSRYGKDSGDESNAVYGGLWIGAVFLAVALVVWLKRIRSGTR